MYSTVVFNRPNVRYGFSHICTLLFNKRQVGWGPIKNFKRAPGPPFLSSSFFGMLWPKTRSFRIFLGGEKGLIKLFLTTA
jgi:hypothetical protein